MLIGIFDIGKTDNYWAHISALKTTTNQLVVLLHSPHIQQPCQLYRRRWEIELLFKVLKTSGFDLEATHICNHDRLVTLDLLRNESLWKVDRKLCVIELILTIF